MRIIPFAVSALISAGLVFALDKQWGAKPPFGKFLSPQQGFWQNAEPANQSFNAELKFPELKAKASVYFDERLVPHVFAENDEDLYFIQGYLHARFRLFQMDLQTKAAAGRASEMAGTRAIHYDREQRRLGMVYAAENALKEVGKDPVATKIFNAYTKGVNSYISSLTEAKLPLEYKMLNIKPEKWTNLRTALLLKMMAKMLSSGTEHDLEFTNAKSVFTPSELKMLYPQTPDSLAPIIPKGTAFDKPGIIPAKPAAADSLYFNAKETIAAREISRPHPENGSNNWVVAGNKTQSGAPILCNDPHLDLSLPSIWYEMQLATPANNSYGVSLPGSPFIIIGFNDSIAWGVTNAQRDVKDYYEIKFKDATKREYWFSNGWRKTDSLREETIKVKGGNDVKDTVAYTVFGPVMYDESFPDTFSADKRDLAVRWIAHDPSNEAMTFYNLNRARNYDDYAEALKTFTCPGQNFVFASKTGDIAIWQQGKFPARWEGQGLYVMPGQDSSFMWQGFIPQSENPHIKNPARGFLESTNQRPVDSTYPYFIPGDYITARGRTIDYYLNSMNGITPEDMMQLQTNYYNITARDVAPVLLKNVRENDLNEHQRSYLDIIKNWDLMGSPDSKGQSVYVSWWTNVQKDIWEDEFSRVKHDRYWPKPQTLMEMLKKDSSFRFIDNILTTEKKTLHDIVTNAFKNSSALLDSLGKVNNGIEWYKLNHSGIYHLLDASKNALLPLDRTKLHVGGSGDILNAVNGSHGPSWRMIVQLGSPIVAYCVFPGGENGNPGSKYYDNFVDNWVNGKYYSIWFMHEPDKTDKKVMWVMNFSGS